MKAVAMARKYSRYVGYPVFFLLCFWVFLTLTFPIERFVPALEQKAGEVLGRQVRIGEASLSPLGRLVFSSVTIDSPGEEPKPEGRAWREAGGISDDLDETGDGNAVDGTDPTAGTPRPPRPGYLIDEVVVNLGLVALLFDDLDLRVDFDGMGGEIRFAYAGPMPGSEPEQPVRGSRGRDRSVARGAAAAGPVGAAGMPDPGAEPQPAAEPQLEVEGDAELLLTIEARNIDLALLHDLRAKVPLPLTGTMNFEMRLASGTGRFADATGEMALRMADIVLGAGNAQIDMGGMPLTIDPITLAAIDCRVRVKEGVAEFEVFETKSADFDLKVKGTVTLGDPLKRSRFDVYLMFKFLEGYRGKSDKAEMLVSNIDQFSRDFKLAHRDDDYWGFRYRGAFGQSRFTASKLAPGEHAQKAAKRAGDRQRGAKAKRERADAGNLPSGPAALPGMEPLAGGGMQDQPGMVMSPRSEPGPPHAVDDPIPRPDPVRDARVEEEPREAGEEEVAEEAPDDEGAGNEAPGAEAAGGGEETAGSEDDQVVE
jgi:hypothetical protein